MCSLHMDKQNICKTSLVQTGYLSLVDFTFTMQVQSTFQPVICCIVKQETFWICPQIVDGLSHTPRSNGWPPP